jgi:uncharacterized membrane protein YphA (DoxX/SURF4 family)
MISISTFQPRTVWLSVGPRLVGATFLWAGIIKSVAPHVFQAHLHKLGWIPQRFVNSAVVVISGLEVAWGVALILGVSPNIILPVTAVALVGLTFVSWWGVRSGRTTDCGCYGGYVVPSLAQSIALNATFIALVLLAWLTGAGSTPTPAWKLIAAAMTGIAAGSFAAASLRYLEKTETLMFDMSPLKVGKSWRARWGAKEPDDGAEQIVSYLGPDCPHCKQWVRVLNAIDQSPGLPKVVGIVAASSDELAAFVERSGIRFPMKTIPQTLMNRLVWGVPTTVIISEGKIRNGWRGQMPPDFYQRFRDAFFPAGAGVVSVNGREVVGGGATRST